MRTAILASQNKNKIKEIRAILGKYGLDVITRDDAGIPTDDIEETGTTFEENSHLKASVIMDMIAADPSLAKYLDSPVIADDSGLCIDALDGAPGVMSARFAGGHDVSDAEKCAFLLQKMADKEQRSARFVSCIACVFPDGGEITARGECEGSIIRAPRGESGFGYDPVFYVGDRSFAEFTAEEKDAISHRGKALRLMRDRLKGEL